MDDPLNTLKAGDVFIWNNYPLFEHEFKNRRWILYLGNNNIESVIFEITATTKCDYYQPGNKRSGHVFFRIPAGIGGLIEDSIIDITMYFRDIPFYFFLKYKNDFEKQGNITQEYVNRLIGKLRLANNVPKRIQKDICQYLRNAGYRVN